MSFLGLSNWIRVNSEDHNLWFKSFNEIYLVVRVYHARNHSYAHVRTINSFNNNCTLENSTDEQMENLFDVLNNPLLS